MKHQIDTFLMTAEKVSFTLPKKGSLTNMKDSLFVFFFFCYLSFYQVVSVRSVGRFVSLYFNQPFILYVCKTYHSLIIFPSID